MSCSKKHFSMKRLCTCTSNFQIQFIRFSNSYLWGIQKYFKILSSKFWSLKFFQCIWYKPYHALCEIEVDGRSNRIYLVENVEVRTALSTAKKNRRGISLTLRKPHEWIFRLTQMPQNSLVHERSRLILFVNSREET